LTHSFDDRLHSLLFSCFVSTVILLWGIIYIDVCSMIFQHATCSSVEIGSSTQKAVLERVAKAWKSCVPRRRLDFKFCQPFGFLLFLYQIWSAECHSF
jgi:hypothetical protein